MLILLSPAKTLDFEPLDRSVEPTKPALHAEAKKLAAIAKELSVGEVAELMELSDRLAETAHGYLQGWKPKWDAKGAKPALFAFRGDVYQGLDADTLTDKQLAAAQDSIRILSGLYGVLRPLDLIQPYRLEMGRKLGSPRGESLYDWWGDRVTRSLAGDLDADSGKHGPLVVNLASNEYAGVVRLGDLPARVVTPVFKDEKNGKLRVVSFFAKRARGAMARHLVASRKRGDAAIESFDGMGYAYDAALSVPDAPVFTRGEQ
ncbi:MAG: peroxide stress protein YaaA [Planctomycetota bacterium]